MSRGLTTLEIAAELRKARDRIGKTQAQIAEEVDVSQPAVQKWESGAALPRTVDVRAVAAAYGVKPELLLPAAEVA